MIQLDFETARDYGWFELHVDLKPLNDRAGQGKTITDAEKRMPFRKMEKRIENLMTDGVSKEELQDMVIQWETNPISKTFCKEEAKWNAILTKLKELLGEPVLGGEKVDSKEEELLLLIQGHDYNKAQARAILRTAKEFFEEGIKPTIEQSVQYTLEELQKAN